MNRHSQELKQSSSLSNHDFYIEELSDQQLAQEISNLLQRNKFLIIDTEVLDKILSRYDPSAIDNIQQDLDFASKSQLNVPNSASLISTRNTSLHMNSSRKHASHFGGLLTSPLKINLSQMIEMVKKETEYMKLSLLITQKKFDRAFKMHKARYEDLNLRFNDIRSMESSFQRQVISLCKGPSRKIPGEVWVRYIVDWLKCIDALARKTRLETGAFKIQYHELKSPLRHREELHKSLRPIDFEMISIENRQRSDLVEQRNSQIADVNKVYSILNMNLNDHKNLLAKQKLYLADLQKSIVHKNQQSATLEDERLNIEIEVKRVKNKIETAKNLRHKHTVPCVSHYVILKAEILSLQNEIRTLTARRNIFAKM